MFGRTMRAHTRRQVAQPYAFGSQTRDRRLQVYAADRVPVRIRIKRKVDYGQKIKVVGSHRELGEWDVNKAPDLKWHEGDVWALEVKLPVGRAIEFKCVQVGESSSWEGGANRTFTAWGPDYSLDVRCSWNLTGLTDIHATEIQEGSPVFRDLASLQAADAAAEEEAEVLRKTGGSSKGASSKETGSSGSDSDDEQRRRRRQQEKERQRQEREESEARSREQEQRPRSPEQIEAQRLMAMASNGSSGSGSESSYLSDDDAPGRSWQGAQVRFMRSNEHSKERNGKWETHGLHGPELWLVEGDRHAANWLGKLGVVKQVLVDRAERARPDVGALAASYVYMQWITTGAIPCVEGGGHYRPNHHARLAQDIFRSLEWTMEDDYGGPIRLRTVLARKVHPLLPSFTEAFTQSVPLTRIRDIAHRNDIPHELKQEIKHTLQNKLHRNAGPEDLVAAETMYARLMREPHNYSGAFLQEFQVFIAELREFFNAGSLTSIIEAIRPAITDGTDQQVVGLFLKTKADLDNKQGPSMGDVLAVMHAVVGLRCMLIMGLSSGLRNDAPDAALAMRQRWRLAEIRSEDYFFVLLSRFMNAMEEQGGPAFLSSANDRVWSSPMGALVLGLRMLGLTGWDHGECMALEHELSAWQEQGNMREPSNALRLKGTLERLQRMTESYTEVLLGVLPGPSRSLGASLGVEGHIINTFTEADIRASVVFQVSKLNSLLLRACRLAAGASAWDPLVGGTATGKLISLDRLGPSALEGLREPVVVLLRGADGDEEVAAAGAVLQGVVLTQELPHLSHLGVRARQEKVPFATLDDRDLVSSEVEPLLGSTVTLIVSPDSVLLRRATAEEAAAASGAAAAAAAAAAGNGNGAATGKSKGAAVAGNVSPVNSPRVVQLLDCIPALSGAKAAACAQLEQVSLRSSGSASFKTPRGICIPFGVMELALAAGGEGVTSRWQSLLSEAQGVGGERLEQVCDEMQELVSGLQVPPQVLKGVQAHFPAGTTLICRSSANVEDLEGMSGAGLYESVMNVPVERAQDLARAVAEVWASLYTRRAVLSRRVAGVPQDSAHMAVLVQEMLAPNYSFVLHSASPLGNAPGTAVSEVAPGLGETLASGTRGSAWRLATNKATGEVETLAFANFSKSLVRPTGDQATAAAAAGRSGAMLYSRRSSSGGSSSSSGAAAEGGDGVLYECSSKVMDYSRDELSVNKDARTALGRRLGALAALLEKDFAGPQDVEGCIVGTELYVVQTRPQPL